MNRSLTELRGLAQLLGVQDVFSMDRAHLQQAIDLKQQEAMPKPVPPLTLPPYDARLMKKSPARMSDKALLDDLLAPYVERGLKVTYPDPETWEFRCGKKIDTGTMRMPPRLILQCAESVLV